MRRILMGAFVIVALSAHAWAQALPQGAEFQVNTYTTDRQGRAAVAMNSSGSFVVVWEDRDGQDGSGYGVFGRLYDSAGAPLGDDFQVNAYTTGAQLDPSVAMDDSGGFLVAWEGQDGSSVGVIARRFDEMGMPLGAEFQVNSYITSIQNDPAVAMSPSGDFIAAWSGADPNGYADVFGRRFDSTGSAVGGDFQVNTYTTFSQGVPAVAIDSTGSFVVAWTDFTDHDGLDWGIFGRRYDSAGAALGGEFQVNTFTTGQQKDPAVAASAGSFVAVWDSPNQDGSNRGVFGQRFGSSGLPVGGEFQVNTSTYLYQGAASVAMDDSGSFVVVWTDEGEQDGHRAGVFGQRFGSAGAPIGGEFQVNTYTTSYQIEPAVARDSSGVFVVAWSSSGQDGSDYGVFGQRFCDDSDGDGLCDTQGITLTSPLDGDTLDCSDPKFVRPTITWEPGNYDRFRVYVASDPGFVKGTRVTSGDGLLRGTSWIPSGKKWRNACNKALAANPNSPVLYVEVLGVDVDLPKKDAFRTALSQAVQGIVQF